MKLTAAEVLELRERYTRGEGGPSLARRFGISKAFTYAIATGRARRDVPLVNISGRVARPNTLRGSAHPGAKLREADVVQIRQRHRLGESVLALAADFGVSRRCIDFVLNLTGWAHVA